MKTVLVTGGCGYIGSHCVVQLIEAGYTPIIYDDFSNSYPEVLERIKKITGVMPTHYKGDIRDAKSLSSVFEKHSFDAVIHFAGKKSVNESERLPLLYYSVNVSGSINLLSVMQEYNVKRIVFSSTATVYGECGSEGVKETAPLKPINNYGKSKLMFEEVLREVGKKDEKFAISILRYFNPVGAHSSGLIGEDPLGLPANLMPFISQVAAKKREKLKIFGDDYQTRDGTGSRDYIHVEDLASAHIAALRFLEDNRGTEIFNLGTGKDTTVLELVNSFSKVNNISVPYEVVERRAGDSAICFADPSKANKQLGWVARRSVDEMCKDAWHWQFNNPNGYRG